ncbi:BZ3500_MvSof-1268-A1-R1_Chr6-3g08872 [Microbotryum saponariae]|uniref:BZ3500_MvSof-1268-A1-R1_Chr6-3g08872 protein n=1 Tax=Microbotryum saponariae TaxID=289078 RepID=A0A2X0M5Z9_9BASI|nr:BZ3500_MvSof-1268-A1-R1_Chr6-3g08872 [Microbotryum saponariae]SDA07473.1 BZ3501_MvSof-1269-A2-R1_Chr6-2g08575 [Microbotryum saponariae]
MLDHVSILTRGGLVLYGHAFTPSPSPINDLIRSALIEQRSNEITSGGDHGLSTCDKDAYTLLWSFDNQFDLVFVIAYQRILQLTYVQDLLVQVKRAFVRQYEPKIEAIQQASRGKRQKPFEFGPEGWESLFAGWHATFMKLLREQEQSAAKTRRSSLPSTPSAAVREKDPEALTGANTPEPSAKCELWQIHRITHLYCDSDRGDRSAATGDSLDAESIARNIAALRARQKAGAKGGRGGKKAAEADPASDLDSPSRTPTKKAATKWSDSKVSAADLAAYDYSSDAPSSGASTPLNKSLISSAALGKRTKSGLYEVADYATAHDSSDDDDEVAPTTTATSTLSAFFGRLSLQPKALSASDLTPALVSMREHLMSKNVAKDIADKVCESVGKSLEGKRVSGFGGVKKEVRHALQQSLTKILTPKTSTDLLLDITRKRTTATSSTFSSAPKNGGASNPDPYSITFVGVNGVGKSTNLSKVAFWLLQNKLRVLIAACDTFRSGAVEQLRTHVRNLGQLGEELGGVGIVQDGVKMIELYEKGYGKDASGIAKEAIAFAKENAFDVVLIDTAGRMQDNEPLMRALAKLVTVNNPDKIVFVGEALVGNEAVDQLTKFNRSLRDFSGVKNARGIDGMILTKFDTIDNKVGAALSMTYVTGQPILFVGTGQTYSDLRSLRVAHIVAALLQD